MNFILREEHTPMNDGKNLSVGIVGCGNMGHKHAINCSKIKGVEVAAVVDTDMVKASALGAEIKATAYDNTEKMFASTPLDAVIIATPPRVRCEIVKMATTTGQASFAEKPIALDLTTAKRCRDAVKEGSVVNASGFQLRYSPMTRLAQTLISGRPVTHVRTACTTQYYLTMNMPLWFLQREHSGGPLLEQAIHVIDMARYLVGEIIHVFARGNRLIYPDLDTVDSEDTIVLTYQFANGALGSHIDSCAMKAFNWEVEIFGTDWRLLVDYARNRLCGNIDGEIIDKEFSRKDLHLLEMETFLKAVRHPGTNGILSDFADATRTLAVVLAGDRSLKTGTWEPVVQ